MSVRTVGDANNGNEQNVENSGASGIDKFEVDEDDEDKDDEDDILLITASKWDNAISRYKKTNTKNVTNFI